MDLNNSRNGHTPPPRNTSSPARIKQAIQAARLQRFAYDAAQALREANTDPATGKLTMDSRTAKAVKELVGAWDTARDALRVLRGKGLPASVRSKASSARPVQPLDPA